MSALGFSIAAPAAVAYLATTFAVRRTRPTWWFDLVVLFGLGLAVSAWVGEGFDLWVAASVTVAAAWFGLTRWELSLPSPETRVGVGDLFPEFEVIGSDGGSFTRRDLLAAAPAVVVFYRGWWCPYCTTQLEKIRARHREAREAGVSVFAVSVDEPWRAAALEDRLQDAIRVLSDPDGTLLDAVGVRHRQGVPWYDRLFGVPAGDISLPVTIAIDRDGIIRFAFRSPRIDVRPALGVALEALGVG